MSHLALEHPAEKELFNGRLSCQLVVPVQFVPGEQPALQQQSESLLHGLAVAEDSRSEDTEDHGEVTQSMLRVEAKLDLVLSLLGRLAMHQAPAMPSRHVRWSNIGLRLDSAGPVEVAEGTAGALMLRPVAWLSDHIELPAHVVDAAEGRDGLHHIWLRFGELSVGLDDALQRHLFRLHRRQVAEARQTAISRDAP